MPSQRFKGFTGLFTFPSFPIWAQSWLSDFQKYLDFKEFIRSDWASVCWACLFLPPLVCPICQSLIFQLVSKVAIRVSRCMEGEEVTQPMCHTTEGRRQGVSPRLSHRGVSAWLSQRISARVSHRQAAGGVNRVRRMWLRLSLRWHLLLLHLYAATFHLYHTCCWVLVQTLSPCVDATDSHF